ncbi:MAG: transaldolase [Actinomycetota bacterium]
MNQFSSPLQALSDQGVSVWLDDLSRELLNGGDLDRLITDFDVVGVTTNPTIFASALAKGDAYSDQLRSLVTSGADLNSAIVELTTDDVRRACDVFRPVFDRTSGLDGRVSLEVDPGLAHDTERTIATAQALWQKVDRPNLMIKIPATPAGLPAITEVIGAGMSINVTLIFALHRYREVMNAFMSGLELAKQNGHDLTTIRSVASFFVSRVDTEIDRRLTEIGTPKAISLRGKAAVANARLAFQAYEEVVSTPRWDALSDAGAHPQRPLWASTGVKNPEYADTMYVTELVTSGTVNTMPLSTLNATADHATITGDEVRGNYTGAHQVMDSLAELGVDYSEVVAVLEQEGVDKFISSWQELCETVRDEMTRLGAPSVAEVTP